MDLAKYCVNAVLVEHRPIVRWETPGTGFALAGVDVQERCWRVVPETASKHKPQRVKPA